MNKASLAYHGRFYLGKELCRLSTYKVSRQDDLYTIKVSFPVVSSLFPHLTKLVKHLRSNDNPNARFYTDDDNYYEMMQLNEVMLHVKHSECVTVGLAYSATKHRVLTSSQLAEANYLEPARAITWNDAYASVKTNEGYEVIKSDQVRSVLLSKHRNGLAHGKICILGGEIDTLNDHDEYQLSAGVRLSLADEEFAWGLRQDALKVVSAEIDVNDIVESSFRLAKQS